MSEADTAWLAGLLEGEGSFILYRNTVRGKVYLYPQISVRMTDRDVIEKVASLFGTSVYNEGVPSKGLGTKTQYSARISGKGAVRWMRAVLPYMGQRRAEKIRNLVAGYPES